ncbi:MAG: hypothetical protein ABR585_07970 [Gemmatimonadaceae bacterium]
MPSRMTPEQLAKAKGTTRSADDIRKLATAANGLGVSRRDRDAAAAQLEKQFGKRGAAQRKEEALQSAGARPKGLRRFFS